MASSDFESATSIGELRQAWKETFDEVGPSELRMGPGQLEAYKRCLREKSQAPLRDRIRERLATGAQF